jgi:arylsulfatase A-like enzyme
LWDKIQQHPVLANDTLLICMPEHGRNLEPNGLVDANGLRAFDHTSDENSRDVFALIAGPSSVVAQGRVVGTPSSPVGESIDIVPTIAHALGFLDAIPPGMLPGRVLEEAWA